MVKKELAEYHYTRELGSLECLKAQYHSQNFSRHSHEGYTIGVIERGAQKFYRTGGNHIAPSSSIILVNADEVHNGCSATAGGWSYQAIYPLPAQFIQINSELGNQQGAPYFKEAVIDDLHLSRMLQLTFSALHTSGNSLLKESLLYSTLVKLMTRHGQQRVRSPADVGPSLQRVREYLDEHCTANISLDALAAMAELSPYHLLRQFQKKIGLPPHAYLIQARVRVARKLIARGLPLVEISQLCGFFDQSHLNRHFKKTMGITPGNYARAVRT